MQRSTGILLVVAGLGLVLLGVLVWSGALSWFGRLPGDVRHESGRTQVFFPITSMIVASIVVTVLINVVGRFLR